MKFRALLFNVLIMIVFGAVQSAGAADVTLTPSIGLAGIYDDNILFNYDEDGKKDDFVFVVVPEITYNYATEINNLKALARLNTQNYVENDEYNAIDQICQLEGNSNITELLTLSADFKYIKDDTLKSQLDETGRVSEEREDRQRYDIDGRLFFNLTELIRVGGGYRYRQTDYDSEITEDYSDDRVSFIYNQRLKNQLDSIRFNTSYAYREVRTRETNTYRMTLGWSRDYSETLRIRAAFGGRLTEQYTFNGSSNREKNESSGLIADIRFYKLTHNMRTEINYRRDQVYEANGGAREVDYVNVGMDRNLTERLAFGIDFKFYWTRDVDEYDKDSSQYYEAIPKIVYNLTENHRLGLYYSYQYEYDDAREEEDDDALEDDDDLEPDRSRNRIWLGLTFNFPRKL